MSALSNQQVRHMYVVTGASTAAAPSNFTSATTGQAAVFNDLGKKTAGNYAYFLYKNNKGYISKTDNIYKDQVVYAKTTDYAPESFKEVIVTPVNVTAGVKYVLEIQFLDWYSVSPENQYFKLASYTAKTGDDAEAVVDGLVKDLAYQFMHETGSFTSSFQYTPKGGTAIKLPGNKYLEFSKKGATTSATLVIKEKEQYSNKDKVPAKKLMFNVNIPTGEGEMTTEDKFVDAAGTEVKYHSLGQGNGKVIAEQEWFYLGERGDIYRNMGYPNNFETSYMADASKGYVMVDITFFYQGHNEDVQKSQKQLYFVFPFDLDESKKPVKVSYNAAKAAAKTLTDALGTILGITINSLSATE